MKKENYGYGYKRYNTTYYKEYTYRNASRNWAAVLHLSVGYQKPIGKHTQLLLAPYVKLPLKGVGIGRLPIASSGMYLGIRRSLQ